MLHFGAQELELVLHSATPPGKEGSQDTASVRKARASLVSDSRSTTMLQVTGSMSAGMKMLRSESGVWRVRRRLIAKDEWGDIGLEGLEVLGDGKE